MEMDARFRPWLDALRRARLAVHGIDQDVVYLAWPFDFLEPTDQHGNATTKTSKVVIEALELLALLGEGDPVTWRQLVQGLWPDAARVWHGADETQVFRVGVKVFVYKLDIAANLQTRFLAEDISGMVTKAYRTLRSELVAVLRGRGLQMPSVPLGLVLNEDVGDDDDDARVRCAAFDSLVKQVAQAVYPYGVRTRGRPLQASPGVALFRLQEIEVVGSQGHHSFPILFWQSQYAALGIRLRHLRLDFALVHKEVFEAYSRILMCLLEANEAIVELAKAMGSGGVPVDSIGIDSYTSAQTYDSVFSAVALSQSIRKVAVGTLDFTFDEDGSRPDSRDRLWRWIALVFRGGLERRLDELTICAASISAKDIEVFKNAISAGDAFATLFPDTMSERVRGFNATVAASKFWLSQPPAGGSSKSKKTKKNQKQKQKPKNVRVAAGDWQIPLVNLRVIAVDGDWLGVLFPGWGEAWVKRSDAILQERPRTPEIAHERPVHHLHFTLVTEARKENVLEILRVVGSGLTALTIETQIPTGLSRDVFLRSVVEACPNLNELVCDSLSLTSLESFAWFYEEGICSAQKLTVDVAPASGVAHAVQFFTILGNEDHPMAKHLRELHLTITPRLHSSLSKLLESVLEMLVSNLFLCRFYLCVKVDAEEISNKEQALLDEFANYDQDSVCVRLAPLTIPNKVAFLSVANIKLTGVSPAALTAIFEYAAESRKRCVWVETKPRQTEWNLQHDDFEELKGAPCPCCSGGRVYLSPPGDHSEDEA